MDIGRMEDILLSYSIEELQKMQAHLLRVREAFMYAPDGSVNEIHEFDGLNPAAFLFAGLQERRSTIFPTVKSKR